MKTFILKKIIPLIFIVLCISLNYCIEKRVTEIEPNNSFSFANNVQSGSVFYGYIDSKDDKDFYKIEIVEDTVLDISLSGIKGINHSIKIWKATTTPELLKLVDDSRKSSPERMVNIFLSPGIYYLSIQHGDRDTKNENKEIPYKLSIDQRAPVNEEKEPNDTLLTANKLDINSEITGFYSPAYNKLNLNKDNPLREEDWFSIEVQDSITLPAALNVSLSGVSGINAELSVYNSSGERIVFVDKATTGFGEEIKNIGIQEPGLYYISIASKGYKSNNDLPYTLDVQLTDVDKHMELENNNTFTNANFIVDDTMSGNLDGDEDTDVYFYQYAQGDFFRIELIPIDNCDVKMILSDINKNTLYEVNNSGIGSSEVFSNFFTNESFYITVQHNGTDTMDNCSYNCIISPLVNDYMMEKEPNNTKSTATELTGEQIMGFSSYKNDVDYFVIKTNNRTKKAFEITGTASGSFTFSVTDPLGYVVKTQAVSGEEKKIITEMIDKKGYIIIEHQKDDYKNPYHLIIKDAQ